MCYLRNEGKIGMGVINSVKEKKIGKRVYYQFITSVNTET